jgi:hypothetical protein
MDGMLDVWTRQQGIEHLHQSVPKTAKSGINCLTKGARPLKSMCVHALSRPKRAFLVYSSSPFPCCWLNGKLRNYLKTVEPSLQAINAGSS